MYQRSQYFIQLKIPLKIQTLKGLDGAKQKISFKAKFNTGFVTSDYENNKNNVLLNISGGSEKNF